MLIDTKNFVKYSQLKREERTEKTRESLNKKTSAKNAEAIWEKMTPEEKARLIEQNRAR